MNDRLRGRFFFTTRMLLFIKQHPERYTTHMKILIFDADHQVRESFDAQLPDHEKIYIDEPLHLQTLHSHPDAEVLSVFVSSSVTKECFEALPSLKLIVARSTGVDHIDMKSAEERGVVVCNVPKYGARTVAEFTFALILGISRRLSDAAVQVRESGDFNIHNLEGFDLYQKTIGVVGTGAIGKSVVAIARGFGMRVLMFDPFPSQEISGEDAQYVSLEELLAHSDIVTLHVPYTPENHHLLNADRIHSMKRGAILINTARGELVDSSALIEALKTEHLAGAGLDVLEKERMLKDEMELVKGNESIQDLRLLLQDHELMLMPRVIVTPHIAFFSQEAYREILATSIAVVQAFEKGSPINRVKV